MTEFLCFTLAAPLTSFGAVAVGERRPTWDRPSKSQIVGLVAGCLGIERVEEARHSALAQALGYAVRIDARGQLASDYHTAQEATEPSMRRRIRRHGPLNTRADELCCDHINTVLSQREFFSGALHTIALWRKGDGAPVLNEIARSLAQPVFAPFVGRKALPLMLPMSPRLIEAETVEDGLTLFDQTYHANAFLRDLKARARQREETGAPIFADLRFIPVRERQARVVRYEERRDLPESRAKWRFGPRAEALLREAKKANP